MESLGQLSETPPKETHMYKGLLQQEEENTQETMVIMMVLEGHIEIRDPLIEGDIQTKVGDPLTREDTLMEDPLVMEDPQRRIS